MNRLPAGGLSRRQRKLGEFELIRRFISDWIPPGEEVRIGSGDDASALDYALLGKQLLLQTTDLLVENIHFRKGWGTPCQLGWKALAVNLSDIAAMGGTPRHVHLSLAIPPAWLQEEIMEFRQGFLDLAARHGIALLGGDLCASPGPLMISVMVNGTVEPDRVLRRSGAKPGEVIWVSRTLGDAAGGRHLLEDNAGEGAGELLQAFLRPQAEVELGALCGESGLVSALIDLSDGLAGDLGHILEMSGVGATVEEVHLPLSVNLRSEAQRQNWDLLELALRGGEDYALLGCTPRDNFPELDHLVKDKLGRNLFPIGGLEENPGLRLHRITGETEPLRPEAFDHFAC